MLLEILCIQHVPFERPGAIAEWARLRGHALQTVLAQELFSAGTQDPTFDALVLMGGPMSANDTESIPWLAEEDKFIQRHLSAGRKMLGICLGAQMLARALGGVVTKNRVKEIGWFPVAEVTQHPIISLEAGEITVFHWHGETFSIPPGAIHLLRSERCENQAFLWEGQVLALQCHPEMTAEGIEAVRAESEEELRACGIPENGETLLGAESDYIAAHGLLFHMLDSFFSLIFTKS